MEVMEIQGPTKTKENTKAEVTATLLSTRKTEGPSSKDTVLLCTHEMRFS